MATKKEITAKNTVTSEKIRIRLKAYDHVVLEQSAEKIVDTAKKTGAKVSAPTTNTHLLPLVFYYTKGRFV